MKKILLLGSVCFAAAAMFADVKPASILGNNMVLQADMPIRVWGTADAGESVTVDFMGKSATTVAGKDGYWLVELPKQGYVREGQTLKIQGKNKIEYTDILVGELWLLSGQSNMEWAFEATEGAKEVLQDLDNPQIRYFNQKKRTEEEPLDMHGIDPEITWKKCDKQSAKRMSAVGVLFGNRLSKELNVPVGLINASVGGARLESWIDKETAEATGESEWIFKMEKNFKSYQARDIELYEKMTLEERKKRGWYNPPSSAGSRLACCYNALIHPLEPLAMRGELWYQGEMNTGNGKEYAKMFPKFAEMMRKKFKNPDLWIYTVQLPDFDNKDWPGTREAQRISAVNVPKSGMAVLIDQHEIELHPREKRPLSKRLSEMALADVYGKKYDAHSPINPKATLEKGGVKIVFDNAYKGLKTTDNTAPRTFEVSQDGKNFVSANAKISNKNTVILQLPEGITSPVAVRYGWAADPDVNLVNSSDLPVSPFTLDL